MKTALSIAGSDCSGGAGIQADIKTMSAIGVFGMSVIVSVVAENTSRVISIEDISPKVIADQIDAVFEDIEVDAVKVGMLSTPECMEAVAGKLIQYQPKHVVIDPVMYAKNGCPLMQEQSISTLISTVIPLATLLTPNIPEAEKITGMRIETVNDMKQAAKKILLLGAGAVLVKGGHYMGDAQDILYDGREYYIFTQKRIQTKNTHGTGCTLSSAIASYLALGETLERAVNDVANILLACGGSPIMADDIREAADIASAFRNELIGVLLKEIHFAVIRGNLSELSFIAGLRASTRGVDSSADDVDHDPVVVASSVAKMYHCIAAITGAVDLVTDGIRVARISNGVADMSLITGTGCMLTGVIGAYVGANEDAFLATVNAVASMGIAGEISLEKNRTAGTGSLHIGIIDAMSQINDEIIEKRGRIIYED